jgi:hypothetical protein
MKTYIVNNNYLMLLIMNKYNHLQLFIKVIYYE